MRKGWFSDSIRKLVGNGQNTSSWKDLWLGGGLLEERYEISIYNI